MPLRLLLFPLVEPIPVPNAATAGATALSADRHGDDALRETVVDPGELVFFWEEEHRAGRNENIPRPLLAPHMICLT